MLKSKTEYHFPLQPFNCWGTEWSTGGLKPGLYQLSTRTRTTKGDSRPHLHPPLTHPTHRLKHTRFSTRRCPIKTPPNDWLAYAYSMMYQPNNSSSTYICVFIVTVCDEKHLPHFIHAAEQQWQLPLEAKGNIQVTHKSYRHSFWEKHSIWYHQTKKRQIKPSSKQTHVLCTGQSQESCWSIQVTPPEHSPGEEGEGEGLSRAAVPLPTTVPGTLCCSHRSAPAPSPFPKWAQRQVKSELTSHKLERIIIPTSN